MVQIGSGDPRGRSAGGCDRDCADLLVAAVFDQRDLLWRLRRLLPHQMGAFAVGQPPRPSLPAGIPVAAADYPKPARLRRSSSALSHHPDSVYLVSRPANGGQGVRNLVREPGSLFVLLA